MTTYVVKVREGRPLGDDVILLVVADLPQTND